VSAEPDWQGIAGELDREGCAIIPCLLSAEQCRAVAGFWPRDGLFRKRIDMARHCSAGRVQIFRLPVARSGR
jgi:hypothetical protein